MAAHPPGQPRRAAACHSAHRGSSSSCVRSKRARTRAGMHAAAAPSPATHRRGRAPPWPTSSDEPPGSATLLSGATYRRFVRLARRPDVTRAKSRSFWRSVAATSYTIFWRSDRWIGDFFAPSQSRFAGPTSSAYISSTAAPFGVLPVPVRNWTLWLQWDLIYLSAVQVIEANSLEVPASLEETQ
ncbi:leucine-rich repeat extensin-like protein 4 [Iris pallida]|uniref:Leucine-rich repeat extensin-like protein 4 n=1 Tax=Iris pallida TaxID=29817 RepID=A0AAX6F1S5_IRIPA|nr:leucine-rich repeat extensin-like protein 4 [Iris pallida]